MRSRLAVLLAIVVFALMVVGVAAAAGRPFSTTLTGAAEVPGPGDPDASGQASITLKQGAGQICFDLSWANVDGTVIAAHIHVGDATSAGPVVVGLFSGAFGGTAASSGCVAADQNLIKTIRKDPANYYVNVHSSVFPAGAIRGQLGSK
jgi:CHRD domain